MPLAPWTQTHLLTWTPAEAGYPQRFLVMVAQNPDHPGMFWALRREDWPGTTARWEFSLHTRKWFRLGVIASLEGRKGEWAMARLEEVSNPRGVKLLM